MKHKKLIVVLLLSALLTVVFVASIPYLILYGILGYMIHVSDMNTYEKNGVTYEKTNDGTYRVDGISDFNSDITEIYVLDEINEKPVTTTQRRFSADAHFFGNNLKRIYFPWSITSRAKDTAWSSSIEYIFSASTTCIIDVRCETTIVVPRISYEEALKLGRIGDDREALYETDNIAPANISYMFNYIDNPNEGYFFIDLLEESGKLTKPPYDPKREGYTFAGWYIDAECTKEWNFETDEVIINYDEEGNRIYEEFCLYAKWTE